MDDLNPVSVKSGFGPDTESYESTEYPIPENGIIRLAFVAPKDPSVEALKPNIEILVSGFQPCPDQSLAQTCISRPDWLLKIPQLIQMSNLQ